MQTTITKGIHKTKTYSYSEIIKEEGVYRTFDGQEGCLLFLSIAGHLFYNSNPWSVAQEWTQLERFIKVNETITLSN